MMRDIKEMQFMNWSVLHGMFVSIITGMVQNINKSQLLSCVVITWITEAQILYSTYNVNILPHDKTAKTSHFYKVQHQTS